MKNPESPILTMVSKSIFFYSCWPVYMTTTEKKLFHKFLKTQYEIKQEMINKELERIGALRKQHSYRNSGLMQKATSNDHFKSKDIM